MDCSASSSPEKAGKVTESLRHTGSEGRRGGFPHRAVEAWHVQRRHALRSGVGVGIWKLSSVMASMLLEQRVSSLPGNLHVPGVNEEQQGVCDLRLNAGGFFFLTNNCSL